MSVKAIVSAAAFSLLLTCSPGASAQDERTALVQRIAAAQGLNDLFEQQRAQSRQGALAYGKQVFDKMVADAGGTASDRQRAAFERLLVRGSEMFSGAELTNAWVSQYGRELSLGDLSEILRYYESPVGRKDVAASKLAMTGFSQWLIAESQRRTTELLSAFVRELRDTTE